jgi:hypothetical protein
MLATKTLGESSEMLDARQPIPADLDPPPPGRDATTHASEARSEGGVPAAAAK